MKAKVTVISSSPMSAAGVYETFLAVLQVNGFAAIPAGDGAIKIVLEANARTDGGSYVSSGAGLAEDEIVTHVYQVQNASAQQLVAMLRPLVAQSGQLAAYAGSNSLIISDRASNVVRMERLIRQIDQTGDRDVELIPLENASAAEVVRSLTTLLQQSKQADPTSQQTAVIADDRSNSVLIAGDKGERDKLISVIKQLDAPTKDKERRYGSDLSEVRQRRKPGADPGRLRAAGQQAGQVRQHFGNSSSGNSFGSSFGNNNSTPAPVAPSPSPSSSGGGGGNGDLRVLADKDTNSLVITATPKIMAKVKNVIAKLDIRRSQVLVEGIVAEVSATKASSIGVDYIAYDRAPSLPPASSIRAR